jgi:hypothetical protein
MTSSTLFVLFCFPNKVEIISWLLLSISLHEIYTTTYNISVDIFGYFTNIIYNNRLFPNVTTDFVIEMIPITQPQPQPIIEERLELPPHPRDVVEE